MIARALLAAVMFVLDVAARLVPGGRPRCARCGERPSIWRRDRIGRKVVCFECEYAYRREVGATARRGRS